MEQKILSVTELNQLVRGKLERDPDLQSVCIRGEISNYKLYPSGHHYFSLKDPESAIRCVLFRGSAASLRFRPENGMQVLAVGRVSLYPRDGPYQFYCTRL
ncbi:MAG: exodeoxyribonuclease VII large subunit, partial [Oscillospiraceae bacterium]|nr:exodeoxyribonuclease VII large subunit [Oscillospiraceae bacterium]